MLTCYVISRCISPRPTKTTLYESQVSEQIISEAKLGHTCLLLIKINNVHNFDSTSVGIAGRCGYE